MVYIYLEYIYNIDYQILSLVLELFDFDFFFKIFLSLIYNFIIKGLLFSIKIVFYVYFQLNVYVFGKNKILVLLFI